MGKPTSKVLFACSPCVRKNHGSGPKKLRLSPKKAVQRIRKAAAHVYDFLRASGAPVPSRARLMIDCEVVRKHRVEGDKRAFFHIGHKGAWTACGAHEAGYLPENHLYGLLLHEFGHPMAWTFWNRSRQQDADRAILKTTGVPILYKTGLTVQWITNADVAAIKSAKA